MVDAGSTPPRRTWRLQVESVAAGMLSGALVAGLIALAVRLELLNNSPAIRWVMVVAGSLTGVIVAAQYLKNRGVDA